MENENIKRAQRLFLYVLVGFIIFQTIGFIVINFFILDSVLDGFETDQNIGNIIRIVFPCMFVSLSLLIDILLLKKVTRYNALMNVRPTKCIIEDVISFRECRGEHKSNNVGILVRNLTDNKLYYTIGEDNYAYYSYTYARNGNQLAIHFLKDDNSEVNIGDTAYLYIKEIVTKTPKIEILSENKIKINERKHTYYNTNPKYDINFINNVVFYRGLVEINKIS